MKERGLPKLYLIRHGHAAGGRADDLDPGLSALGREQAAKVAQRFAVLAPLQMVSSPLRRCRETSAPLKSAWGRELTIEQAVAEILTVKRQFVAGFLPVENLHHDFCPQMRQLHVDRVHRILWSDDSTSLPDDVSTIDLL